MMVYELFEQRPEQVFHNGSAILNTVRSVVRRKEDNNMNARVTLTSALLIALTFCTATLAQERTVKPVIRGTFQGQVYNGDDMDPVLTTFKHNANGDSSGTYAMGEEDGLEVGMLSDFEWEGPYTLKCKWKDKYGTGTLRILFSAEYRMFRGFWGKSEDTAILPWDGVKQD
jgi:hypothetical protein